MNSPVWPGEVQAYKNEVWDRAVLPVNPGDSPPDNLVGHPDSPEMKELYEGLRALRMCRVTHGRLWAVQKDQEHDHLGRGQEGPIRDGRKPLDWKCERPFSLRDIKMGRDDLPVSERITDDAEFRTFLETDCTVASSASQEQADFGSEPSAIFDGNELPEAEEICRKWVQSHFQ
jgi:hypothetical protein